jgi:hypothetical protein
LKNPQVFARALIISRNSSFEITFTSSTIKVYILVGTFRFYLVKKLPASNSFACSRQPMIIHLGQVVYEKRPP